MSPHYDNNFCLGSTTNVFADIKNQIMPLLQQVYFNKPKIPRPILGSLRILWQFQDSSEKVNDKLYLEQFSPTS